MDKYRRFLGLTHIDGEAWIVALPDGGSRLSEVKTSEFTRMVNLIGEEAFHCEMSSWCHNFGRADRFNEEEGFYWSESGYVHQYDGKQENWTLDHDWYRGYSTGFRPILIPINEESLRVTPSRISHMKDGDVISLGTLYMNGEPLENPNEAKRCHDPSWYPGLGGDIPKYSDKASLSIGDTSADAAYQIKFIKFGDKLVADRVLIGCISLEDLDQHLLVKDLTALKSSKKDSLSSQIDSAFKRTTNHTPDSVVSLGHYAETPEVKQTVPQSVVLHNQTMDICDSIPGYRDLPREDANALYDLVKKSISQSMEKEKHSTPER